VLDTETTTLDVHRARIVEIGAVAIRDGHLTSDLYFNELINPGEPVPDASSVIHGIKDEMLKDKPGFRTAIERYHRFAGRQLVLGYSVGFDLAVLRREHERAGLPWQPPRALDVKHLVEIIAPPLPNHSLETVAAWLGLETRDRHTAMGDAVLTARIFLKLLPGLRGHGIRTLAEAEAACRKLADKKPAAGSTGWIDTASTTIGAAPQVAALARVDSYPYRHKVSDIMSAPAVTIAPHTMLRDALRLLMDRRISSAFVEPEAGQDHAWGIITERDILRALDADPARALDTPVGAIASRPLETVGAADFLYKAFGRMRRKRFRHLGVRDQSGKLVGALTQRDLLKQRADEAIALTDALDEATGVRELAIVWRKLSDAARSLLFEEADPRDIAAIISSEVCGLTRRAAELAIAEMPSPPPVEFAVFVLGSAGRGESLLAMDQDNAIIFTEGEPDGEADQWLAAMAARMNAILHEVGVALCKGGVMARNPRWRMDSAHWRRHVSSWLSRSNPEDILNADIFFDALPVYGREELCDDLRRDAIAAASQSTPFLKLMSLNAVNFALPLGWFGRWSLDEDGRMDLKKGGLLPIFSAARVLALKNGLTERATSARLEAMRGRDGLSPKLIDNLLEAHRILLGIVLRQQLIDIEKGTPPSSRVDPRDLQELDHERLRWALEQVKSVGDLLGDPIA
jgi:DNA polymerase-3 subunit epsilon/CBS domain-containing protein